MGWSREHFAALFDPRGVIVAGASTHPGKFGFVALHNILANGYRGRVFATNLEGTPVLGVDTVASIDDLPDGRGRPRVRVHAGARRTSSCSGPARAKGVQAAFITSAGYGEAGEEGRAAQAELVARRRRARHARRRPERPGRRLDAVRRCARRSSLRTRRPGTIGIASQSGNFVSTFMNYARHYGVGVSRAVSAGNAAAVGVADYLDYYADDPETDRRPGLRRGPGRRPRLLRPRCARCPSACRSCS